MITRDGVGWQDRSMTRTGDVIAERVRSHRQARGWSVRQLADECIRLGGTQLTAGSLGNIERGQAEDAKRGRRNVTVEQLLTLARAFGVPPERLWTAPTCSTCGDLPPSGYACLACRPA